VLAGLAFATLSALSAAALRRSIVFTPPGGEDARAVVLPGPGEAATGGEGGGDDIVTLDKDWTEGIWDRSWWYDNCKGGISGDIFLTWFERGVHTGLN